MHVKNPHVVLNLLFFHTLYFQLLVNTKLVTCPVIPVLNLEWVRYGAHSKKRKTIFKAKSQEIHDRYVIL